MLLTPKLVFPELIWLKDFGFLATTLIQDNPPSHTISTTNFLSSSMKILHKLTQSLTVRNVLTNAVKWVKFEHWRCSFFIVLFLRTYNTGDECGEKYRSIYTFTLHKKFNSCLIFLCNFWTPSSALYASRECNKFSPILIFSLTNCDKLSDVFILLIHNLYCHYCQTIETMYVGANATINFLQFLNSSNISKWSHCTKYTKLSDFVK